MNELDGAVNHSDSTEHSVLRRLAGAEVDPKHGARDQAELNRVVSRRSQQPLECMHRVAVTADVERTHVGSPGAKRRNVRHRGENLAVREKLGERPLQGAVTATDGQDIDATLGKIAKRIAHAARTAGLDARYVGVFAQKLADALGPMAPTTGGKVADDP